MYTRARLKRWGSSLGIVIPSGVVREKNLKEGEEIVLDVKKKSILEYAGILTEKEANDLMKNIEEDRKRSRKRAERIDREINA